MGAITWMLVLSDDDPKHALRVAPVLDWSATVAMAARLFPHEQLTPLPDGSLEMTCPPDDELVIGSFVGLTIVAAKEFAIDYPSRLPKSFLESAQARWAYLIAMHSVVDWFAYAIWRDGVLQRALSAAPDNGIVEDICTPLPFEAAFWDGDHPTIDPAEQYPLPFHPLEMAEEALFALLGYCLEGPVSEDVHTENVTLMRFCRTRKRWWKFGR